MHTSSRTSSECPDSTTRRWARTGNELHAESPLNEPGLSAEVRLTHS